MHWSAYSSRSRHIFRHLTMYWHARVILYSHAWRNLFTGDIDHGQRSLPTSPQIVFARPADGCGRPPNTSRSAFAASQLPQAEYTHEGATKVTPGDTVEKEVGRVVDIEYRSRIKQFIAYRINDIRIVGWVVTLYELLDLLTHTYKMAFILFCILILVCLSFTLKIFLKIMISNLISMHFFYILVCLCFSLFRFYSLNWLLVQNIA